MSTRQEDLKLDRLELRDAVLATKDVAGIQWYDLGLQLRLLPSILDTIAADHQTSDDRKRMMLSKWLQSDPEASWERLAAALALIGHETTAANVRAQFVKVTVQVVAEADQDEIRLALTENNLQKIKAKFSSLSHEVQSALQSSQASVNEVYSFLVRCFSRDDWIQNPSNFDQLFNALSVAKLWNYDHYGPLEEITKKFLPNDAAIKTFVFEYKSHLTGFYTTTKIADFVKVHKSEFEDTEQDPQESLPVNTYTLKDYRQLKLTLNLGRKISALTLSYVDELWRSLAEEFDLPSLTAVIHKIVKGSLQVSWLILPHIAEKITSASTKAVKFFRLHDVTQVEVDNIIVFDEEKMTEYESQLFEICVGEGDIGAISELISQHGVDVNIINESTGRTALSFAAEQGYVEIIKLLIIHGADVDIRDKGGKSALWCASNAGNAECVKVLVKYGAQVDLPDEYGNTALMKACDGRHVETARVLLHHGTNVDHQNQNGLTILYFACGLNYLEAVEVLLEYGAQVNKMNNDSYGDIPLTAACGGGNADIAMLLIDKGAIVNFQSKRGTTPLHATCINSHSHIAKLLIERGADIDVQMKDQRTPLFLACFNGDLETVNILLKAGAQPDIPRENGLTGLMVACQKGLADIAKALLEARADTDMTEESTGRTALFFAAEQGYVEIIKLLIIHGADVDIRDKTGVTAADVAKVNSHQDICDMLQQHSNQEKNTELSKEQKLEVKSVGSRVRNIFNILEKTFLSERVRKREHQMQKEQQYQENRSAMTEIEFKFGNPKAELS